MSDRYSAVTDEYRQLAPNYDERWARYVRDSQAHTLKTIGTFNSGSALDVACGTGTMLQSLHQRYPEATLSGCDISPEMLEIADTKLGSAASLINSPAEKLPYPDNSFELITCNSALHYFPDAESAVREMWRVLLPGGQLVITDWCNDFITVRFLNRIQQWRDPAHIRTFGSRQLQTLISSAGMNIEHCETYKLDWFWGLATVSASKPV